MLTCCVSQNKSNIQYISVSKVSTGYVKHSCEGHWNGSAMLFIYFFLYLTYGSKFQYDELCAVGKLQAICSGSSYVEDKEDYAHCRHRSH